MILNASAISIAASPGSTRYGIVVWLVIAVGDAGTAVAVGDVGTGVVEIGFFDDSMIRICPTKILSSV